MFTGRCRNGGRRQNRRFHGAWCIDNGNYRLEQKLLTVPVYVPTSVGNITSSTGSGTDSEDQSSTTTNPAAAGAMSQAEGPPFGWLDETSTGNLNCYLQGIGGGGSTGSASIGAHFADLVTLKDTDSSPANEPPSFTRTQSEGDNSHTTGTYAWSIVNNDLTKPMPASTITVSFSLSYSDNPGQFFQDSGDLTLDSAFLHVTLGGTTGLTIRDANQNVIKQDANFVTGTESVTIKIPIAAGTGPVNDYISFSAGVSADAHGFFKDATYADPINFTWDYNESVSADS